MQTPFLTQPLPEQRTRATPAAESANVPQVEMATSATLQPGCALSHARICSCVSTSQRRTRPSSVPQRAIVFELVSATHVTAAGTVGSSCCGAVWYRLRCHRSTTPLQSALTATDTPSCASATAVTAALCPRNVRRRSPFSTSHRATCFARATRKLSVPPASRPSALRPQPSAPRPPPICSVPSTLCPHFTLCPSAICSVPSAHHTAVLRVVSGRSPGSPNCQRAPPCRRS